MLHRTLAHFDGQPAAWNTHEALTRNVEALHDGTDAMDAAAEAQAAGATKGLTEAKQAARRHAATLLAFLGRKVGGYALEAGDPDLGRAVDRGRSVWLHLADEAFVAEAGAALNRVEAILHDLGPYEVTADDVAAARAAVKAAHDLDTRRDLTAAGHAVATDELEDSYTALVPTLALLDRLVPALVQDADFVATYVEVRRIRGE